MGVSNFLGGVSIFFGGGSPIFRGGVSNFPGGGSPSEYGQRSAGTHPTGMHSCSSLCYQLLLGFEFF